LAVRRLRALRGWLRALLWQVRLRLRRCLLRRLRLRRLLHILGKMSLGVLTAIHVAADVDSHSPSSRTLPGPALPA